MVNGHDRYVFYKCMKLAKNTNSIYTKKRGNKETDREKEDMRKERRKRGGRMKQGRSEFISLDKANTQEISLYIKVSRNYNIHHIFILKNLLMLNSLQEINNKEHCGTQKVRGSRKRKE